MNANELADELEIFNGFFVKPSEIVKDSIAMLRQQQAEIEALKNMLEEEGIGVSKKYLDKRISEMKVNK